MKLETVSQMVEREQLFQKEISLLCVTSNRT